MNNNFETHEFEREEAFKEFDRFIDVIKDELLAADEKPRIINPYRIAQMQLAYALLKKSVNEMMDVKLSYELYEPFKSMGSISLEGDSLEFYNSELFSYAVKLADNMEVYALKGDRVRMSLAFHTITMAI